jgi:hypothetical protein
MRFYLKEWPDDTVTLMTESGRFLWTFDSVEDALTGLREWEPPVVRAPAVAVTGTGCGGTWHVAAARGADGEHRRADQQSGAVRARLACAAVGMGTTLAIERTRDAHPAST